MPRPDGRLAASMHLGCLLRRGDFLPAVWRVNPRPGRQGNIRRKCLSRRQSPNCTYLSAFRRGEPCGGACCLGGRPGRTCVVKDRHVQPGPPFLSFAGRSSPSCLARAASLGGFPACHGPSRGRRAGRPDQATRRFV